MRDGSLPFSFVFVFSPFLFYFSILHFFLPFSFFFWAADPMKAEVKSECCTGLALEALFKGPQAKNPHR